MTEFIVTKNTTKFIRTGIQQEKFNGTLYQK